MSHATRRGNIGSSQSGTPDDVEAGGSNPLDTALGVGGGGDFSPFVWTQLAGIQKTLGKLEGDFAHQQQGLLDLKSGESRLVQLESQIKEHLSFVKGVTWMLGIVFTVGTLLLAWAWSSIIQPGLAHAIVEQIKPEIRKQVTEAVAKQPAPNPQGRAK